jgi:hypothetical protein
MSTPDAPRTLSIELAGFVFEALAYRAERIRCTPEQLARAAIINGLSELETAAADCSDRTPSDHHPPRHPMTLCDDLCDASAEAIEAINERIALEGLELSPESFEALRDLLYEALRLADAQPLEP